MITMAQSPSVINLHTMQTQHSKVYSALHYKSRTSITQYISPVLLDHMLQDDNSSLNKVCISRQIMSHFIIFHDSNEDDINLTMSIGLRSSEGIRMEQLVAAESPVLLDHMLQDTNSKYHPGLSQVLNSNLDITRSLLMYQHMNMDTYNPVQLDQSYFSPDQMR